ncbi:MAG TPA: hypothetical protein VF618_16145 [Thermoanaerobaculia bacterium]
MGDILPPLVMPPIRFLALSLLLALPITAAAEMQITAACRNVEKCVVSGTLVLRDAAEEISVPVRAGVARFDGDASRPWEMELRADNYWSPRQRLGATIDVWRTTPLRGRFATEKDAEALPQTFAIVVESPLKAKGTKIAKNTLDCPIAADGSWECPVPAALLDLTLRPKGFIPHYVWEKDLVTTAPATVGTLTLRQGGSFVAWLDRDTVAGLKKPATARLIRMASATGPQAALRLLAPVAEATFNGRGAVQLAPVPPGTYTLEITAPGFATSRLDRIEILARSESTFRQPIRLEPPLDLRLTVTPAVDPQGRRWRLGIGRRDAMNQWSAVGELEADTEPGIFHVKQQAPGLYNVNVYDADNNAIADRTFTVSGLSDAEQRIELSLIAVSGVVTVGKEPVAAKLLFGGTSGVEKITSTADADGKFSVTLPRAGRWVVEVTGDDVRSSVGVDVVAEKELKLELPDTVISGWVTGPTGERVTTAQVQLFGSEGNIGQRVKADGTFRFRGAPAGRITASDLATGESSPMMDVILDPGGRAENIELPLLALRTITGVVTSRGEKLAGAMIMAQALDGTTNLFEHTASDVDGTFRVRFPAKTRQLSITAAAAGRTIQAFAVPVQEAPVRLDVAPEGGTLRLLGSGGSGPLIIQYQGATIPLQMIGMWLSAHQRPISGDLVLPNAAPGQWRVCRGAISAETCREGLLPRGGTLDLELR